MKNDQTRVLFFLLTFAVFTGSCREAEKKVAASGGVSYSAYAKGKVDIEGGLMRLASSRDGLITQVLAEEGETVRQGAALAVVDDRESKLKLAIADAEVAEVRSELPAFELKQRTAERELDRLAALIKQDAAPRVQWEQAVDLIAQLKAENGMLEARVRLAEARREADNHEVELHQIRAPLDGRIVKRLARPGDGVSTQTVTALFLFEPNSPHIVRAELDERFVGAVHEGDAAEILLETDESKVFQGRILRIGQVFGNQQLSGDPNERADQRVVECVVSMSDRVLRIGQRVVVRIPATRTANHSTP